MRNSRILIAATALFVFAACSTTTDEALAVEASQDAQAQFVAAFLSADPASAAEVYGDEISFNDPTFNNTLAGKSALASQAETVFGYTDVSQTELLEEYVSADGTRGTVSYHWVGENFYGQPFDIVMTQLLEYEAGEITSITNHYATADTFEQLSQ